MPPRKQGVRFRLCNQSSMYKCPSFSAKEAHFLAGNRKISRKGPVGKEHFPRKYPNPGFLKYSEISYFVAHCVKV